MISNEVREVLEALKQIAKKSGAEIKGYPFCESLDEVIAKCQTWLEITESEEM